jgi:hypothetical protein
VAARAAVAWSLVFAGVHLFWAAGGETGLATSAGAELARQRPTWFVVAGLYGVAVALLVAAALALFLSSATTTGRRRWLVPLAAALTALLLLRGVGLEVLLLVDPGYGDGAVSGAERFWSLVLWNPWFALGGVAFGCAAVAARRRPPVTSR